MELYGDAMEYPAIHVKIILGDEDLTVKVHTHTARHLTLICTLRLSYLSIIIRMLHAYVFTLWNCSTFCNFTNWNGLFGIMSLV